MSGIYIEDEARRERRRVDWARVHREGDRNPPLGFTPNPGKWVTLFRRERREAREAR